MTDKPESVRARLKKVEEELNSLEIYIDRVAKDVDTIKTRLTYMLAGLAWILAVGLFT